MNNGINMNRAQRRFLKKRIYNKLISVFERYDVLTLRKFRNIVGKADYDVLRSWFTSAYDHTLEDDGKLRPLLKYLYDIDSNSLSDEVTIDAILKDQKYFYTTGYIRLTAKAYFNELSEIDDWAINDII